MHDTADILPHLLALNNIANSGDGPTTAQVQKECSQYESAMIDRAFNWVRKSGGASMPVSGKFKSKRKVLMFLTACDRTSILMAS